MVFEKLRSGANPKTVINGLALDVPDNLRVGFRTRSPFVTVLCFFCGWLLITTFVL